MNAMTNNQSGPTISRTQFLHKASAVLGVVGILLFMLGGMHVRGGADGTWVQINLIHTVGGVAIFGGIVLSLIGCGRSPKAELNNETSDGSTEDDG